jgi:hypothetical protein
VYRIRRLHDDDDDDDSDGKAFDSEEEEEEEEDGTGPPWVVGIDSPSFEHAARDLGRVAANGDVIEQMRVGGDEWSRRVVRHHSHFFQRFVRLLGERGRVVVKSIQFEGVEFVTRIDVPPGSDNEHNEHNDDDASSNRNRNHNENETDVDTIRGEDLEELWRRLRSRGVTFPKRCLSGSFASSLPGDEHGSRDVASSRSPARSVGTPGCPT